MLRYEFFLHCTANSFFFIYGSPEANNHWCSGNVVVNENETETVASRGLGKKLTYVRTYLKSIIVGTYISEA